MRGGDSGRDGADVPLKNGARVTIRPMQPTDEARLEAFHAGLSTRSVHHRYFHMTSLEQRIAHTKATLATGQAPGIAAAIVAESAAAGEPAVMALGRLTRAEPLGTAEIAMVVIDAWQGLGLGTAMMDALLAEARRLGVRCVYGDILADNDAMRAVVRRAGFVTRTMPGDAGVTRAELSL
jgi:acetyltransferase